MLKSQPFPTRSPEKRPHDGGEFPDRGAARGDLGRLAGGCPGCRLGDQAVVDEDQRCHWRQQCAGQMPCPDYCHPHSELKTPSWMDAALWCFKGIGWAWLGYLRVSTKVFGKESNEQFKYPASCHA